MEEDKVQNMNIEAEILTEQEAMEFKKLLNKFIKSYSTKDCNVTDKEWLKNQLRQELPQITDEESETESTEIINTIEMFDNNLSSVNESTKKGISKELWLADKLQEAAVGMSINEYGKTLQSIDDFLYLKNQELHEALLRSSDGNIKMCRNLDGIIAENMIAKSAELSAFLQGKNIKVEVRNAYTSNSVDVRAINLDTGKYQNYQLKFGKNAEATIKLIERGNYNNQQIIVPTEQLTKVKAHFESNGSRKTIKDAVDSWETNGMEYSKDSMKEYQRAAQEDGIMPSMDYNHFQTKDLALNIGKNAGVMGLQSAAVSTGFNIAYHIAQGEKINSEEMVEIAITTGADTGIKVVTAGALQVAIRKGIISIIPRMTPAGIIANIACVGIENIKILNKIACGELTITRGLDQMGRVSTSMVGGLIAMGEGALLGVRLTAWIPVIGVPMSVVSGFVGGIVGYFGGSKIGEAVYNTGKKMCNVARSVAGSAWNGLKSAGRSIKKGLSKIFA